MQNEAWASEISLEKATHALSEQVKASEWAREKQKKERQHKHNILKDAK